MRQTKQVHEPPPSLWLRRLTLAVLGLYLVFSAWVLWRSAVLTPYYDELDWIGRWRALQTTGDWATYLLGPVNHHRMPGLFGLLALDIQVFGGTNLPLIVSGAVALATMAGLLAWQVGKAASPELALPAAALSAMLTLMAGNVLDAATPICVSYTHGAVLAVGAVILAEGEQRPGLTLRRILALVAAAAAGLGMGVALTVWPALLIVAARRRDGAWVTALLVVGGAYVAAYAAGQGGATESSTGAALDDPVLAVRLALNFLMLPWARLNLEYAWIGGLFVVLVGLAAVASRSGPRVGPHDRVACGLILFSLGCAAMAGLGRAWTEDPLNVPLRYALLMAPLHSGLIILALPYADRLRRALPATSHALIAVALLGTAGQNVLMADKVIRASDIVRTTLADFKAGARRPEMLAFIHPDQAFAQAVYDQLRREGRFQHELHLKATPGTR
jgi:hypothetical protein